MLKTICKWHSKEKKNSKELRANKRLKTSIKGAECKSKKKLREKSQNGVWTSDHCYVGKGDGW